MAVGGFMTVVVAIELLIAGALVLSYDSGAPWWTALIVAVVLSAMLVAPPGRTPVARVLRLRFGLWRRHLLRGSEPDGSKPDQAPFDIPVPDETPIGARWDGTTLVTVLRIDTPPPTIGLLDPSGSTGIAGIPLTALAESVRQFDIELESIDVVSHGIRSHGTGRVAQVYLRTLGPLPATAYRSVLVVLRLDPSRCPEAVARRGGGSEGALRTAIVATRRVANRIGGRGLSATALTAAEITAATTQLAHGAGVGEGSETWESVSVGRLHMSTFAVSPDHLAPALDAAWAVPSVSTTVTMALRPNPEGDISLRTLVRFNTIALEPNPARRHPPIDGLIPLHGRQRAALAASLPVGAADRLPPIGEHVIDQTALGRIFLAAAGCGQLIGADHSGRAVAVDLLGGRPHRISIAGGLHLAQQILLRAIGVGARVLIYSDRPADWQQFVTTVGDPGLVALAGGRVFPGHFTVAMCDGLIPTTVDAPTIINLAPPGAHTDPADIRLVQNHASPQDIWISTPGGSAMVTMVATGDEIGFIGSSLPSTTGAQAPGRHAPAGATPVY
jgi:type VII secretion protein EccE